MGFVLAPLCALALVAVAAAAFRKFGTPDEAADGPTVGHSGGILSALFLLVFAIAVIVPWTVADSARQNTQAEAQSIIEIYWAAGDLPDAERDQIRTALTGYTAFVVDQEWARLKDGELDPAGWERLDTLRATVGEMTFTGNADLVREQAATISGIEDQLEDLYAARRQRAVDAEASLPAAVPVLTVITGLVVLLFPMLAGARPRGMALVPMLLMAALLGLSVYLVFDINHVFAGSLEVTPEAFRTALQEFPRIP